MGVLQLFAYQLEDGSGSVRSVIGCGERQQATDACDCGERKIGVVPKKREQKQYEETRERGNN